MADFYTKMQGIASDLLTRFNQGEIILLRVTPGAGPANNPGPATEAPTTLKATARPAKGSVLLAPGTLIKLGDLKVVAKVEAGAEPSTKDRMTINGQKYNIIRFDKIPASGVTVAWVFYVRRG